MADLRMPSLNSVILAARLTRDPEMRHTSSGRAMCKLGFANTRYYRTKDGERREDTTFVDATLWDQQAEFAGQTLHKGSPVIIEGSLRTDSWDDKQTGEKRSKLTLNVQRITPLEWDDRGGSGGGGGRGDAARSQSPAAPSHARSSFDDAGPEDDIPF